eukprot:scaffold130517_cov58-Attheya_sp.AAC.4
MHKSVLTDGASLTLNLATEREFPWLLLRPVLLELLHMVSDGLDFFAPLSSLVNVGFRLFPAIPTEPQNYQIIASHDVPAAGIDSIPKLCWGRRAEMFELADKMLSLRARAGE